jgi:hypothetical protein
MSSPSLHQKDSDHAQLHDPSLMRVLLHAQEIECSCDNGCDNDPGELEPVKEGHPDERWILEVVKRRIEQDNERDKQEDE